MDNIFSRFALMLSACLSFLGLQIQLTAQQPSDLRSKGSLLEALEPATEEDLNQRLSPVVKAVQRTQDSVVNVDILGQAAAASGKPKSRTESQGSGVILDEKGLVITNWHVVAKVNSASDRSVRIRMRDGKNYTATLLSSSPEYDLALLQMQLGEDKVTPIILGDSDSLMVGETTIAIGNPQGHAHTVTVGVLSAEDRSITVRAPDGKLREYNGLLQTDAAINQGNSGGALLDITGKLIGINNAMAVGVENIGFAIPVNTMRRVFHEVLLSSEFLTSLFLGMRVQDVDGHPIITKVLPHGPAAQAGVQPGDRLLKVRQKKMVNALSYARSILDAQPEQQLPLLLQRSGKQVALQLKPMTSTSWALVRQVGAEFAEVAFADNPDLVKTATMELARQLGKRVRSHLPAILQISQVHPNSPAAKLGLAKGDVLLGIQVTVREWLGERVTLRFYQNRNQLKDALDNLSRQRNPSYPVLILRDGKVLEGPLGIRRP